MSALLPYLVPLVILPFVVLGVPLHPRLQPIGTTVDPSTDEWASTLSGVGPLVLLIGERTTKQVLRNVRSIANAFSLAAAPLGLLSVVTSLIRFCGAQKLRAFIGYELEARSVIGMEVTRVNCAGVSAHLADGYVMRSIAANPASQLVAAALLQGKEESLAVSALERIKSHDRFESEKKRAGVPEKVANAEWSLCIVATGGVESTMLTTIRVLVDAIGSSLTKSAVLAFQTKLVAELISVDAAAHGSSSVVVESEDIGRSPSPTSYGNEQHSDTPAKHIKSKTGDEMSVSVIEIRPTFPISDKSPCDIAAPFWDFAFISTFDAVSEFTSSSHTSRFSPTAIGVLSSTAILVAHILALYENNWVMSVGWILVVVGYCGIVTGVLSAAFLIHASCACVTLDTRSRVTTGKWKEGMIVSVKNTDSMDTTGSDFVSSSSPHQTLEAVWIKPSSPKERALATLITILLVASFIAHYLGLRAVVWWDSVAELCICITAAFARSVSNDTQPLFTEEKDIKIDKRCMSTGIIKTQSARLTENRMDSKPCSLDARAYSLRRIGNPPSGGERAAFHTAILCLKDPRLYVVIMELTAMNMTVTSNSQHTEEVAILASFTSGILVSEGLASPNAAIALAFRSSISDLAAPTALLVRGIMRQPEWKLDRNACKDIPLGNVYLSSMQSMLDWWTLSEDRNDMGDLQKNLHWSMFLVNVAFFMGLSKLEGRDGYVREEVGRIHGVADDGDMKVARNVVGFLEELSM